MLKATPERRELVFVKKLNELTGRSYRLPSESEWMYAANGGSNHDTYTYAGSNDISEVAWWEKRSEGNSGRRTHIVGTRKPNSLGIYDMTGNVWEWCSDRIYFPSTNTDSGFPADSRDYTFGVRVVLP